MRRFKVPVWNGEFGPVYEHDNEGTNLERYNMLRAQLRIYDRFEIPWSIWLYKDIGVQGMVYTSPEIKESFLSETLSDDFASYFSGMDEAELEEVVKSFSFEQCMQREGLNKILRESTPGLGSRAMWGNFSIPLGYARLVFKI
ncbi:unnamed protein product [Tuber aestivum]|uniref:Glycoside hydrolase family 5 domain-containing protein n=1 Tax=Tuber aestivum TaxID=59557 RepID=A0A292PX11_9PEZI|nr:unnamed protein product [Tuber aestivum]